MVINGLTKDQALKMVDQRQNLNKKKPNPDSEKKVHKLMAQLGWPVDEKPTDIVLKPKNDKIGKEMLISRASNKLTRTTQIDANGNGHRICEWGISSLV